MDRNFPIIINCSEIGNARGCLSGVRLISLMGFLVVLAFVYGIQISKVLGGVGVLIFLIFMAICLIGYRDKIFSPFTTELKGYRTKQIEIWEGRIVQIGNNFTENFIFDDIQSLHLVYPNKLVLRDKNKRSLVLKGNMWPVNDIIKILEELVAPITSREYLNTIENGKNISYSSHLSFANSILAGGLVLCVLGIASMYNEVFGIPKGVFIALSILTGGLIGGITLIIGYFITRGSELIINKNCIKRPFEGFGVELCWIDVKQVAITKDNIRIEGNMKSYKLSKYAPSYLVFVHLIKTLTPHAPWIDETDSKNAKGIK